MIEFRSSAMAGSRSLACNGRCTEVARSSACRRDDDRGSDTADRTPASRCSRGAHAADIQLRDSRIDPLPAHQVVADGRIDSAGPVRAEGAQDVRDACSRPPRFVLACNVAVIAGWPKLRATVSATLAAVTRKSFYSLDFSVQPGGARYAVGYVRGTLDEIRADLAVELTVGQNVYLLCWYGATLGLSVHQHGVQTGWIDLHPYVTISIEGYSDITFAGSGQPISDDVRSDDASDDSLSERLLTCQLDDKISAVIDWESIDVPTLLGDLARPGDLVAFEDDWLDEDEEAAADDETLLDAGYVRYGHTDFEA
jgi:hypothetical protein